MEVKPEKEEGPIERLQKFFKEKGKKRAEDWTPINLAKSSVFKDPKLWKSRRGVIRHIRGDLEQVLPGSRNFAIRQELAKGITTKRGHGLTRKEIRDEIKKLESGQGGKRKISRWQARKLRGFFGVRKSGLF